MRALLSLILFCTSISSYSQPSDSSFNKQFLDQFISDRSPGCWAGLDGPWHMIFFEKQEVFNGCFDNARIYFVTLRDDSLWADHVQEFYPVLYVVDGSNGKIRLFKDSKDFCQFVNSAKKPIANLDIAYLYVSLFCKAFQNGGVADPSHYWRKLRENSVFANYNSFDIFFAGIPGQIYYKVTSGPHANSFGVTCPFARKPEYCELMAGSAKDNIVLYDYGSVCLPKYQVSVYKHRFCFDSSDRLVSVVTDTLYSFK